MPTVLSSSRDRSSSVLSSSRDDETTDEMSATHHYFRRDKRFFINKNQFVVSSTFITYAFVNTTVTVTANLIPPAEAAVGQCLPAAVDAAAAGVAVGVACLPTGYIVCPVPG